MNKIVREHYPASRLPEDLRSGIPPDSMVRITVEAERPASKSLSQVMEDIDEARRAGGWPPTAPEEAVSRIRSLRDEWDDERS